LWCRVYLLWDAASVGGSLRGNETSPASAVPILHKFTKTGRCVLAISAFWWGIASAVSLPLGAILGLLWRPGSRITSGFMAFGAGALLFALSIELLGHVPHYVEQHGTLALVTAMVGALTGGTLFAVLNQLLNDRGGFLRNLSSAKDFVARSKKARAKRLLKRLSKIPALRDLPPEEMAELVRHVSRERYRDGETIFTAGDQAREVHFVRRGQVDILAPDDAGGERRVDSLDKNDTFGELAVYGEQERRTSAQAVGDVTLYTLEKDDLEAVLAELPQLREAIQQLAEARVHAAPGTDPVTADQWEQDAEGELDQLNIPVSETEVRRQCAGACEAKGAAMAVWMGIAIDGIPESLVIGTLAIGPEGMSLAFVVGVFLANFPEAMSSAASLRRAGMRRRRIMTMWGSLCLLTGLGALAGALMFPPEPTGTLFFVMLSVEALAAGAMLTMIAQTMLPEAFEQGGSIVGIATLLGFLAALAVAAV